MAAKNDLAETIPGIRKGEEELERLRGRLRELSELDPEELSLAERRSRPERLQKLQEQIAALETRGRELDARRKQADQSLEAALAAYKREGLTLPELELKRNRYAVRESR